MVRTPPPCSRSARSPRRRWPTPIRSPARGARARVRQKARSIAATARVIDFKGDQRTDSKGGVPAYRNKSVTPVGPSRYRIVDLFTTGQIRNGSVQFTLRQVDDDHIELNMQPGGTLKLQRCQ